MLVLFSCAGVGAEVPSLPALQGARVRAAVTRDQATGIYSYSFRLENSADGTLPVSEWTLDARSDSSRAVLSSEALTFDPTVPPSTAEHLHDLGPSRVTAIGLPSVPTNWLASVDVRGFARWTAGESPLAIGSSESGFLVTSRGLPGIRETRLAADRYDELPNPDDPGSNVTVEEIGDALEGAALQAMTVGPVAPPADFSFGTFAAEIATARTAAEQHGWVRSGPGLAEMDALLAEVRDALAQNDLSRARSRASAFVDQVEAISCATFDCPADPPLTSEARALLGFNMKYLRDQLPAPTTTVLTAAADSTLRPGVRNTNEGANPALALGESGSGLRVVVAFDLSGVDRTTLQSASLVLTVNSDFSAANWGTGGGQVDVYPLLEEWSEGNGRELYLVPSDRQRGNGPGVTWNCAIDAEISNQSTDCDPSWSGGSFGTTPSSSVLHTNGMSGEVTWDVTADVQNGASSWLLNRRSGGGSVRYHSGEGSGGSEAAPRLVIQ